MSRLLSLAFLAGMFVVASGCKSKDAADRGAASSVATSSAAESKHRRLEVTYAATIAEIPAGSKALKLWIPKARQEGATQKVLAQTVSAPAGASVVDGVDSTGETSFWCVTVPNPKAPVTVSATYDVVRAEQKNNNFRNAGVARLGPDEKVKLASYLAPNARVPVDGLPAQLASSFAADEANTLNVARSLYDGVLSRMRYDKSGTGWGQGDTLWACGSGYGNCTDFHSMFMSFSRARGIPARFFMGLPIPEARGEGTVGGYHCWAEFYVPELGWVPVDISEADKHPELAQYYFGSLTEDRVSFTLGRDLVLDPSPASGTQNFFIYPIAEVDGKSAKAERAITYKDR